MKEWKKGWEKAQVREKINMDICGAAFLLGINREDEIEVLEGKASPEDLGDPSILCIEVGGRGWFSLNNWDHEGEIMPPLPSKFERFYLKEEEESKEERRGWRQEEFPGWQKVLAEEISRASVTFQIYYLLYHSIIPGKVGNAEAVMMRLQEIMPEEKVHFENFLTFLKMMFYIHRVDMKDSRGLAHRLYGQKPHLSDLFYGMMLVEQDTVEQLYCGIEILRTVVSRKIDSYGPMPVKEIPEWAVYAEE